jgi:hypothetical protein
MNKTVYLRDEEVPIWEKARELAGDKLSPIIVTALRRFIAENEASAKGYNRIELAFDDSDDNNLPKKIGFYGRWIFDLENPLKSRSENDSEYRHYSVGETAKGNVFIYTHKEDWESSWAYEFKVYPSFEKAGSDNTVNWAVRRAMEKRGVPVEELDI